MWERVVERHEFVRDRAEAPALLSPGAAVVPKSSGYRPLALAAPERLSRLKGEPQPCFHFLGGRDPAQPA